MTQFKNIHTFENRLTEAKRIRQKYPDRIPIIVERGGTSTLPPIDKHKFLVPSDLTLGQFSYVIRKRISLEADKAIFLFINNKLIPSSAMISDIYSDNKDKDLFLYCVYQEESVFG